MQGQFRRFATAAVASVLVLSQIGRADALRPSRANVIAQARPRGTVTLVPPVRIQVKEPQRAKPNPPPLRAIRPSVVRGIRTPTGRGVTPLPMLSAAEISRLVAKGAGTGTSSQRKLVHAPARSVGITRGGRQAKALTQNGGPFNTTGITPWWGYHEDPVPGGGRILVNEGLGNMIMQDDDMAVAHKGIPFGFERTYNAQAAASTQPGVAVTWASLYGNGWTNTFDAHLFATSTSTISVYDVDGARYDYSVNGNTFTSVTPGQHATLASDNGCGLYWTKKSGLVYYFWEPFALPTCTASQASYNANAGLLGRLHQIIGRNSNVNLTFTYIWDNADASATGKVNSISVRSESGMTATMAFADFNGRRLLQTLTFPDGLTTVSYGYDSLGNLSIVTKPANNSAATTRQTTFGYGQLGSDSLMIWVSSPRLNGQCNIGNCGADGAWLNIGYSGSSAATSAVIYVGDHAVVNPVINDGYAAASALQSGYPTNMDSYRTEFYDIANWNQYSATGQWQSTFRDTDGHMINWVVDASGRPIQTQVCAASTGQGSQCPPASWLTTSQSWDANNNLTAAVNARGGETDMAYDANGNLVAIAQPVQYNGYHHPTTLIDYDGYNNVVAVCDPALVHSNPSADWAGQYSGGSDSYCNSAFPSNHASAQYALHPWYEPYGQLTSVTSPGGYTTQISHDTAPQGSTDYGLPTKVQGAPITQLDQSSRQPTTSFTYDANGNLVCSQVDSGGGTTATSVMTYDSLNRLTAAADPDDASLLGSCSKTAGIASSSIVTRYTYYADGSLATIATPSEAALNGGTTYTYDLDGDPTSTAPYTSSPQNAQTAILKQWFDGMDRLVETQEPPDPATTGDIPISLRFLYDLSQAQTAATLSSGTVAAYGNMFDTVKNTPTGWTDFTYSSFDSADRVTNKYAFAPCPVQQGATGAVYCSESAYATRYDWDSSPLNPSFSAQGLLIATLDGVGVSRKYTYDGLNFIDSINYAGDNGVTTPVSYLRDFDGRLILATNSLSSASAPPVNNLQYVYNYDGMLTQEAEPAMGTQISYSYYPDAALAGVSATTTKTTTGDIVNQPNLYSYDYRNDGALVKQAFGAAGQTVSWGYTPGGRMTAMTDFNGSPSITAQYGDGHGRLSSYTTPSGSYGSFQYDAEGRPTRYTDPYATVDGETVSSTYNIRGDLVARSFSGGTAPSKPGFQYKNIQGVLVQNATDQYDGRTGAPLMIGSDSVYQFSYDAVGRMRFGGGSAVSYDAENRIVSGDTWGASSAGEPQCESGGAVASGFPPVREVSYLYDGVGRLFQDTQPNQVIVGHQIPQIRNWIWKGSALLYTMSMYGDGSIKGLQGYSADGLGSISGSPATLTIADVDFDGAVSQYHNNTGHSTWSASNPYNQFCQHASPLSASPNYVGPNSNPVPDDGMSDSSLVVDSYGRAYMSSAMGFTTPDYSSSIPYGAFRRPMADDDGPPWIGGTKSKPKCDWQCQLNEAWNQIMAALWYYNITQGNNSPVNQPAPRIASSQVIKAVAKVGAKVCVSSVSVNVGQGYGQGGATLTNEGKILLSGGGSYGASYPPLTGSVVFTFGDAPTAGAQVSAGAFLLVGGDVSASAGVNDGKFSGGTSFDVGVGLPQIGVSATGTMETKYRVPPPSWMCK